MRLIDADGKRFYEKLKHVYDLLGLDETGGEITKDSLLRAAEKFDEK